MNANTKQHYLVTPKPPIVRDELAHIGAGLRFADNPTRFFGDLRSEYGDTFLVDVFGYKLFCVFSPRGLQSLYAAAEEEASFGMATFDMLGFKTPIEVFMDAHIDLFYDLLAPDRVALYLRDFVTEIARVLGEWGPEGELELFDTIRTLEQRVGFRLWMGEEATREGVWQDLKADFDILSQENAFVSPQETLETITSGKAREKEAIARIRDRVGQIASERQRRDHWPEDNFTFLHGLFQSEEEDVTLRRLTHNLINANQGFLSNLYAALAWTLVNIQRYPDVRRRLLEEQAELRGRFGDRYFESQEALDSMRFTESLFMESIRFAQRSITLRKVMREMTFDCGDTTYTLQPGVYITTMLSVTNTRTAELARFDPDHYRGRRLDPGLTEETKEEVSTFGHGSHACPAQKFSHNMCKVLLAQLMAGFEFSEIEEAVEPSGRQMGGVSRAADDVRLRYRRRP